MGTLGVMIGGRAKKKDVSVSRPYLIIAYSNNDELKYIGFDISGNPNAAAKNVKGFQQTNTKAMDVDL